MHKLALLFFFAVGCCANTFASAAIMVPFSNDFSTTSAPFTPTSAGQWTLTGGKYRNEISASPLLPDIKSSSSMLSHGLLGGDPTTAQDFYMSTTFTITNSVADFNSLGFAILGNSADATTSASKYYLADLYVGGVNVLNGAIHNAELRFAEIGPSMSPTMLAMTTKSLGKILIKDVATYMLQLHGTYDDNGNLTLKLQLSSEDDLALPANNPIGTFETSSIPKDYVLTGNQFGFRDRASGDATSALTVEYDSVNITAIPEPSSIGFVATSLIAGYVLGRYMRRKFAHPAA